MGEILLVIQVIVAIALIAFVLLQRSDSDGFGLGSSSGGGVMSGKGKASFMTRTTAILAAVFMVNSLLLAIVTTRGSGDSIASRIAEKAESKELEAPLGDEGVMLETVPVTTKGAVEVPKADAPAAVEKVIDEVKPDAMAVPAAE